MKRFTSLMLVAIMLISTLMLTSCDPIGSVKGFVNKVLGKETGEPAQETQITLEQWLAAGELTNYTVVMDEGYGFEITVSVANNLAMIKYHYEGYIDQTLIYDIENLEVIEGTGIIKKPSSSKIKNDTYAKFLTHPTDSCSYFVLYYYPVKEQVTHENYVGSYIDAFGEEKYELEIG